MFIFGINTVRMIPHAQTSVSRLNFNWLEIQLEIYGVNATVVYLTHKGHFLPCQEMMHLKNSVFSTGIIVVDFASMNIHVKVNIVWTTTLDRMSMHINTVALQYSYSYSYYFPCY